MTELRCEVRGCGKLVYARNYCQRHYVRVLKHNNPYHKQKPMTYYVNDEGCYVVDSHSYDRYGYPKTFYYGKHTVQHRVIYTEMFGEIPKGKLVRHSCDNRGCINPEHLLLGTVADNSRDMIERGRSLVGEKNPDAKLTEKEVIEMRLVAPYFTRTKMGEIYGVTRTAASSAIDRKTWKHI